MTADAALPTSAPVMKAWKAYSSTLEFASNKGHARQVEHTEGALWAAFYEGFYRAALRNAEDASQEPPMQDEREQIARIISPWSDWGRLPCVRFRGSSQKYAWDQYYIWDSEHSAICNPDGPASHVYPWARLDTPEASLEAAKLLNEREDVHWRANQADALAKADQILALRQPPASQFVADMFWKEEPDGECSESSPEDVIADLMDWSGSRGPDIFKLQQAMSGPPFWCVGVCDAAGEVTVTEYPSEAEAKAAIPTPPEPDQ